MRILWDVRGLGDPVQVWGTEIFAGSTSGNHGPTVSPLRTHLSLQVPTYLGTFFIFPRKRYVRCNTSHEGVDVSGLGFPVKPEIIRVALNAGAPRCPRGFFSPNHVEILRNPHASKIVVNIRASLRNLRYVTLAPQSYIFQKNYFTNNCTIICTDLNHRFQNFYPDFKG